MIAKNVEEHQWNSNQSIIPTHCDNLSKIWCFIHVHLKQHNKGRKVGLYSIARNLILGEKNKPSLMARSNIQMVEDFLRWLCLEQQNQYHWIRINNIQQDDQYRINLTILLVWPEEIATTYQSLPAIYIEQMLVLLASNAQTILVKACQTCFQKARAREQITNLMIQYKSNMFFLISSLIALSTSFQHHKDLIPSGCSTSNRNNGMLKFRRR
jgi:hypothetical protein